MPLTARLVHVAIAAIAAAAVAAAFAAPAPAYKVKIRETSYGIPHIKANNYGSAGYGVGFAFAKQNICTFADNNVTTSARRSKFFGPDGESPASAAGPVNNLDSDFFWQSVIDSGRIEGLLKAKGVQSPSKNAKAAIRGYAAGYNAFLKHEVLDSKTRLEEASKKPVRFFCYPFGDYDGAVIADRDLHVVNVLAEYAHARCRRAREIAVDAEYGSAAALALDVRFHRRLRRRAAPPGRGEPTAGNRHVLRLLV